MRLLESNIAYHILQWARWIGSLPPNRALLDRSTGYNMVDTGDPPRVPAQAQDSENKGKSEGRNLIDKAGPRTEHCMLTTSYMT